MFSHVFIAFFLLKSSSRSTLEPRAFLTVRFLGVLLEGSRHHFGAVLGCLWGCLGELLGRLGRSLATLGVTFGSLWRIVGSLGYHLGACWCHFVAPKSAAQTRICERSHSRKIAQKLGQSSIARVVQLKQHCGGRM